MRSLTVQKILDDASSLEAYLSSLISNDKYQQQKAYFEWLLSEIKSIQKEYNKSKKDQRVDAPLFFHIKSPLYLMTQEDKKTELKKRKEMELSHAAHIGGSIGLVLTVIAGIVVFIVAVATGGLSLSLLYFIIPGVLMVSGGMLIGVGRGIVTYNSKKAAYEAEINHPLPIHPINVHELSNHHAFLGFFSGTQKKIENVSSSSERLYKKYSLTTSKVTKLVDIFPNDGDVLGEATILPGECCEILVPGNNQLVLPAEVTATGYQLYRLVSVSGKECDLKQVDNRVEIDDGCWNQSSPPYTYCYIPHEEMIEITGKLNQRGLRVKFVHGEEAGVVLLSSTSSTEQDHQLDPVVPSF